MTYFINQIKTKDCGFASLKIFLANTFKKEDYLYIKQDREDKAYSLKEIIDEGKKYGVIFKGYKVENTNEIPFENKKMYLVNIKENNLLHMVVVLRFTKNKIEIADPAFKVRWVKLKDFYTIWTGDFLDAEEVEDTGFKLENKTKRINKNIVLTSIVEIFAFASLTIGLYNCNKNVSFFLPLAFFILYGILEIFNRILTFKNMKLFDKNVIMPCYLENRGEISEVMINMNNYKKHVFVSPINLVTNILTLLFSIIILSLNSYLNIANIAIILFFQLVSYLFFDEYFKKKKSYLSNLELSLTSKNNDEDSFKETIEKINTESYNLAILINGKKYVGIFLVIVLSLLLFGFNTTNGLNFILFHAFFYLYVNSDIEKIINFGDEYATFKKYKCIYFNYLDSNKVEISEDVS